MPKANSLTEKQKRFVDEYLKDLNGTQAYIRAGYKSKNPDVDCQKLLGNSRVQSHIQKRKADRERRTEITQDMVVAELAKVAFVDIKDYLRYGTERTDTGEVDEEGNPVFEYRQIVEAKPSDQVDGSLVSEVSLGKDGTFKFKLHDKMAALDKLGRHFGLFLDRVQAQVVSTNVNATAQEILALPEDERQKYIDQLARIAKGG